jgi:Tol biopolymer transport system component
VTSPGIEAWRLNLSRDGGKLAFVRNRAGIREIEEKSLQGGREAPVVADADEYARDNPHWSPDGGRLVYVREKYSTGQSQLMVWSSDSRDEEPLTALGNTHMHVYDWSADGKWVMIGQGNDRSGKAELWKLPVAAAPVAQASAVKVAADPACFFFQGHFSPDGQWIVFEEVRPLPNRSESTLYVMRTAGGPWIPITESKYWSDKPRWSPDGRIIYFLASRQGFLNVWAIHFDPASGKTMGDPFPVTAFDSPSLMVPNVDISFVELSLTQDRLALTMAQVSGSIWVLENVDR